MILVFIQNFFQIGLALRWSYMTFNDLCGHTSYYQNVAQVLVRLDFKQNISKKSIFK
jgi:hypothetical protein